MLERGARRVSELFVQSESPRSNGAHFSNALSRYPRSNKRFRYAVRSMKCLINIECPMLSLPITRAVVRVFVFSTASYRQTRNVTPRVGPRRMRRVDVRRAGYTIPGDVTRAGAAR